MKRTLLLMVSIFMVSSIRGVCNDAGLTGHVGKEKFSVSIQLTKNDEENNNVTVVLELGGKAQKIKYPGYDTGHLVLRDLNGDGNDEILFLSYQGADLYDLGVIGYKDGNFQAFDADDFAGRDFDLIAFDKKYLVALKEMDGKDLYYFSDLADLKDQKLVANSTPEVWEYVVQNVYLKWLEREKSDRGKSRINSYIYLAYKKIGKTSLADGYYQKAKALDPANPNLK